MFIVTYTNGIEDRGPDKTFDALDAAAEYIADEIIAIYEVRIPRVSLIAAIKMVKGQNDPTTRGWGWKILTNIPATV